MTASMPFRFDAGAHEYRELGIDRCLPHITGMLKATGWVDDLWFTEESSERGTEVHRLTADYDLEALDLDSCVSPYRGYLLAHAQALSIIRAEIVAVEEPLVHPVFRFGGRPDRLVLLEGSGVLEIKAAAPAKSHPIQTALQAILASHKFNLPPELVRRFCLYLKPNGRFKFVTHDNRGDYDTAREIVRACCV